mmetsp:Transcript_21583/g.38544  ORF Transcript_21583/g.38544 Transcript_21583/m.38544 type:complete len:309 (-) Transcript_21583:792-1718(-)
MRLLFGQEKRDVLFMKYGCISVWSIIHTSALIPLVQHPEGATGHFSNLQLFFVLLLVFNAYLYFKVLKSDPGYVSSNSLSTSSSSSENEEHDFKSLSVAVPLESLSEKNEACKSKLFHPSLKYCRHCNNYVDGFDHHCVWINNCVGRKNHHLFWCYLLIQDIVAGIATHLTLGLYFENYNSHHRDSFSGIFPWSAFGHVAILLFLGMSLISLTSLFIFHTYLLLFGTTTRAVVHAWRHRRGTVPSTSNTVIPDSSKEFISPYQVITVSRNLVWLLTGSKDVSCFEWAGCFFLAQKVAMVCDNSYYSCC